MIVRKRFVAKLGLLAGVLSVGWMGGLPAWADVDPGVVPSTTGGPSGLLTTLKNLTGFGMWCGLVILVGGVVISSVMWAMSRAAGNERGQHRSVVGIIVCVVAAMVVAGASALIRWATGIGLF